MAQKKFVSIAKLGTFLTSLRGTFAPLSHKHKLSDISDYKVDTTLSSTSDNPVANKTIKTTIDGINSNISTKANSSDFVSHTGNKSNPHGVTASQVGLGNVPNLKTNDLIPTYDDTTTFTTLSSGEKLSVAFSKIKLAITNLINHIANNTNPHGVTKSQIGLGNVDNTSDKNKPISTATQTALNNKSDIGHTHAVDSAFSSTSTNPVQNKIVTEKVNSLQASVDSKVSSARKVNGKTLTEDIRLTASDVGADASGTATSTVNTHNTSTNAHSDIRTLISTLTTRLNSLADSDDKTLDQMSELVAYIKANRSLIESVTSTKVNVSDIVNNLTTNVANKPLSAAQGVAIKSLIDALQIAVNGKANTTHTHKISDVTNLQSTLDGKASTGHGHDLSTMINTLSTGSTTPKDEDYYISQYVGGGTTTTTYHRRPMSAMWQWIQSKLANVATSGNYNDLSNKPVIDSALSSTSTNALQNKAINAGLNQRVLKSGDTMTGTLEAPTLKATSYFMSPTMVGEGNDTTYYHRVDFGRSGKNKVDFYEYGGEYNFYQNTVGTKDGAKLIASIQADGFHGNLKGNADSATKVNGHTVNSDVPANAKFTDTTYAHPTTSGNKHIPSGGSSGQILRWTSDGTASWGAETNTWRGIQNNLTSTSTTDSLSAAQGKVLNDKFASYLPLSGGTVKGNLSAQYITGTWLQTTAASNLGSNSGKIAVLDGSGWIYYRTPTQVLSDMGITASAAEINNCKGLTSGVQSQLNSIKSPTIYTDKISLSSSWFQVNHSKLTVLGNGLINLYVEGETLQGFTASSGRELILGYIDSNYTPVDVVPVNAQFGLGGSSGATIRSVIYGKNTEDSAKVRQIRAMCYGTVTANTHIFMNAVYKI